MNTLTDDTPLQIEPNILFGDVDGEIVAMNMESGNYLHLNSSGSFIFSLLQDGEPRTVGWLCQRTGDEYEVAADICRQEVGAFLTKCIELSLLQLAESQP